MKWFVLFFSQLAFAGYVGNDTQNFNPTFSGIDYVTVESSELLNQGYLAAGLMFNRAWNSLPDTINNYGMRIPSDDTVTFGDFSLGYGLSKWVEIGANFSYLLDQETTRKQSGAQFASTGLNEIRLGGKTRIVPRSPLGIALLTSINFNQSRNNPFVGRGGLPTLNLGLAGDFHLFGFLWTGNVGYRLRTPGKPLPNAVYEPLPNQYFVSLGLGYYVPKIDTKFIAELHGAKAVKQVAYVEPKKISAEGIMGFKYDYSDAIAVNAGYGTSFSEGLFTPDWRVYLGLAYNMDVLRKGATTTAAPIQVEETTYLGFQPRDIEAMASKPFDELTKEHEFQLKTEIPDAAIAGLKPPFEVIRLEGFHFDTASSVLKKEFIPMLDKLAAYLSSDPPILKFRVEGHTDSLGDPGRNARLSQARADALKKYLLTKLPGNSVEIEAAGFGADRPIFDNGNFQGRTHNRRVEVRILRRLPPSKEIIRKTK